ncbi:MAG: dephospho-CoA kinase [Schleiferilactobacillus harbinensis]|jgi:dephospho-CoA kinase|nr:dephospho-CoA kinase [Schleiferilactobacillus harbinensis]MCI1912306.1 dephospho-CoA kinase [Schleiferilactobacillus harbinensis]
MSYILGLTGSIATGKSTVAHIFKEKGYPVVDADAIAHAIVAPGTEGLARIKAAYGDSVINPDGSLNRRALGHIVFQDSTQRHRLDRLNGDLIRKGIQAALDHYQQSNAPLIVLDIPLLYESQHYLPMVDGVLVAYVPPALERQRLIERDGLTPQAADDRIAAQLPIEEKRARADFWTDNRGAITDLYPQVDAILKQLELPSRNEE